MEMERFMALWIIVGVSILLLLVGCVWAWREMRQIEPERKIQQARSKYHDEQVALYFSLLRTPRQDKKL